MNRVLTASNYMLYKYLASERGQKTSSLGVRMKIIITNTKQREKREKGVPK